MQCQAEAQEGKPSLWGLVEICVSSQLPALCYHIVTLARAIELKHKHSLVSALAAETSKMFMNGGLVD